MLNVNDTVRTYSGRPGCMCGCNGTYNDSLRARKMAVTQMLKQDFRIQTWNLFDGDAGCVYVETATRNRVLYLTKSGVQKLSQMFPDRVDKQTA